jgi:hypothetical protein
MQSMHHRNNVVLAVAASAGTTTASDTSPMKNGGRLIRRKKKLRTLMKQRRSSSYDFIIAIVATVVLMGMTIVGFMKFFQYWIIGSRGLQPPPVEDDDEHRHILPFHPKYRVPDSIETVGDRSDRYVSLRQSYDAMHPPRNPDRSLSAVAQLRNHNDQALFQVMPMDFHDTDQVPYDIYDCPDSPPTGYPFAWNLMEILKAWPPDEYERRPSHIYQGLCVFDYTIDYDKAVTYRNLELPFIVINDPTVAETVERWNTPGYMEQLLDDGPHRTEYSENNHFMYYVPVSKRKKKHNRFVSRPEGWKEPTELVRMDYKSWLQHANGTDDTTIFGPDQPHWYYRLIGCGGMGNDGSCDKGSSEYLFDELPFFQPKESLYIVEPDQQKGYVYIYTLYIVSLG